MANPSPGYSITVRVEAPASARRRPATSSQRCPEPAAS